MTLEYREIRKQNINSFFNQRCVRRRRCGFVNLIVINKQRSQMHIKTITQPVRPGVKFRLSVFRVQSQISVWSLKRMRHLCMRTAHGDLQNCRRA